MHCFVAALTCLTPPTDSWSEAAEVGLDAVATLIQTTDRNMAISLNHHDGCKLLDASQPVHKIGAPHQSMHLDRHKQKLLSAIPQTKPFLQHFVQLLL